MLWRKKKNKSEENKKRKKKEKEREQEIPLPPTPSSSSSSLSSSSIFSFSWFSKLKKKKSSSSNPPLPLIGRSSEIPILSPPSPLPLNRHPSPKPADSPHRLSLGDDLSRTRQLPPLLARCSRHHSTGGDLDSSVLLRSDLHLLITERPEPALPRRQRRRPRTARADRRVLEEIDTNYSNSNSTIKNGRRSFGTKVQPRPRVTVCSPRLRKRATTTERASSTSNRSPPLERFAVVKSSSDPARDFRESMVEMISEKGIRRPEELERLLACYLSLNSDEHHDAIVKVFRQVWFDLNRRSGRPAGRSHGSVTL